MSSGLAVTTPYNEQKDVMFYEPGLATYDAPAGTFMIFYPDDIHAPSLATGVPPMPGDVVKVVVKVVVIAKYRLLEDRVRSNRENIAR